MSKYTIGIDLGGTTMTAGIVNENYEIVGKLTWATRLPRPAEDLEKALADLCRTVAQDNKVDFADIKYVGIGTPGSVNFTTGFVGFNTNFGYYDWNLGLRFHARSRPDAGRDAPRSRRAASPAHRTPRFSAPPGAAGHIPPAWR